MPLPRYRGLEPEKRRQLVDVAVAQFAEHGFAGASLNEILATAGFGKSSYYYYFADKEDLFATVVEEVWERFERDLPPLALQQLSRDSFWPAVEAFSGALASAAARHPALVALARDLWAFWRRPRPRFQELVDRVVGRQRALLERGRSLGCVRTDIDLDWLLAIAEAADQAVDERLLSKGELTSEALQEHARLALDTFRRLVEPRRRAAPDAP
ncbi:MAG: TetR/AcrR family transcriptional regulator [Myxococcaceae bacterium]